MVGRVCLVLLTFFFPLFVGASWAAISKVIEVQYICPWGGSSAPVSDWGDPSSLCASDFVNVCGREQGGWPDGVFTGVFTLPSSCAINSPAGGGLGSLSVTTRNVCPSNSSEVSGSCVCDAGYVERGGQCLKDEDPVCGGLADMPMGVGSIESDFGKQTAGWASSKIGQPGSACISGCRVSGTVSGCVLGGSAVCMIASPVFTGDACSPEEEEGPSDEGCPDGTVLQPASGLCVPRESSCPEGQEPSKYVEGVCIPKEDLDDGLCEDPSDPTKRVECVGKETKCPSGKVPSKVVPGTCVASDEGAERSENGNTYICKNGVCTVIAGDCDPSQGSCVTEKTKGESCKEAPDLKQCTQDTGLTGSCGAAFQCKGDPVQCSIAVEQHKRNCELFDKSDPFKLAFENAVSSQSEDGTLRGTEVDLSGHFNVDSVIGNGQCPSDLVVTVFGQDVPVKLSEFCQYFSAMGYLIFLGACVSCLRILVT